MTPEIEEPPYEPNPDRGRACFALLLVLAAAITAIVVAWRWWPLW